MNYLPRLRASIGLSTQHDSLELEISKSLYAIENGVDIICDMTIVPSQIDIALQSLIQPNANKIKFSKVPIYEYCLTEKNLFHIMKKYVSYGVKHFTFQLTSKDIFEELLNKKLKYPISARGSGFLYELYKAGKKNPFIESWNEICHFCKENDVEISIANDIRPGCVNDSLLMKDIYFKNLNQINELVEIAKGYNTTLIEVGGHWHPSLINELGSKLNQPSCIMGPITTDALNGFDHINTVMGNTQLAQVTKNIHDILIITPAEHLRLPSLEDLKQGIQVAKMAQHIIGLIYNNPNAIELENSFKTRPLSCNNGMNMFGEIQGTVKACSMCGSTCPLLKVGNAS